MIRPIATLIVLVIGLTSPGVANAMQQANVVTVSYRPPNPFLDVVVVILKGIDNASRNGNADFGLRVTVTYLSTNGTVETVDSGRLSIKFDTTLLGPVNNRTVAVALRVPLGIAPPPGASPSYSATVQVLHKDPATGDDEELGPAEQTFPN